MISKTISPFLNTVNIVEEKWNFLIVLDACRFDVFQRHNRIAGQLEKKVSKGSSTPEWLRKNFQKYYEDIVYVSANPYISNVEFQGFSGFEHFFKVESVWDYGWDEETGTVHPREVAKATLRNSALFRMRRMVVHFMQPHAPYIGVTKISRREIDLTDESPKEETIQRIWKSVRDGHIPKSKLKQAYIDNLKLVLNEVQKLVDKLDGRIVVTSDHGECFGEWFIFGHPGGTYIKELVEVPWLVIEKEAKQEIDEKLQIKLKISKLREEVKL